MLTNYVQLNRKEQVVVLVLEFKAKASELTSILCSLCRNQSAVKLYGWKDVEAVGQRVADLLLDEESRPHLEKAMERLSKGESWSGRFPFRRRSGEMFTALVTQSPLVEDGEYIGIITVSSDAVILDDKYSEKSRENWERVQGGKPCKPSCPRVQWRPQQQIASSVSTLVLLM